MVIKILKVLLTLFMKLNNAKALSSLTTILGFQIFSVSIRVNLTCLSPLLLQMMIPLILIAYSRGLCLGLVMSSA
jgi:tetrahydromethanopterin S-methyltransferase subunit E